MRDRLKKGNKDRRNQPPGGTPEVCAFPPRVSLRSTLFVIVTTQYCSQWELLKKKKKRPKRTIRSAVSIDVPLPIAANQKRNM